MILTGVWFGTRAIIKLTSLTDALFPHSPFPIPPLDTRTPPMPTLLLLSRISWNSLRRSAMSVSKKRPHRCILSPVGDPSASPQQLSYRGFPARAGASRWFPCSFCSLSRFSALRSRNPRSFSYNSSFPSPCSIASYDIPHCIITLTLSILLLHVVRSRSFDFAFLALSSLSSVALFVNHI